MFTYSIRRDDVGEWLTLGSDQVNSSNTVISKPLCTTDRTSATPTASFTIGCRDADKYRTTVDYILDAWKNLTKVHARIEKDGVIVASGYIDSSSLNIQSSAIPENLTLSIRDYIVDLDRKIESVNFVADKDDKDWTGGITVLQAVTKVLNFAGYIDEIICEPPVTRRIAHFSVTEDDGCTYREKIDKILFEAPGLVLWRNPETGKYHIRSLSGNTTDDLRLISYHVASKLKTKHSICDEDGVKVIYPTVNTEDRTVYTADINTGYNDEGIYQGVVLAPGDYWPENGDIQTTYLEYEKDLLDRPYQEKKSRLQNSDLDLLYVRDADMTFRASANLELPVINSIGLLKNPSFFPRKAMVLLHNGSDKNISLERLTITGKATYISKLNRMTLPFDAEDPREYESDYIFDEATAKEFAAFYFNHMTIGASVATWVEWEGASNLSELGESVMVRHKGTEKAQGYLICQIDDKSLSGGVRCRNVTAIAVTDYDAYTVRSETNLVSSGGKRIIAEEMQYYSSDGPYELAGGEWSNTASVSPDKYLWTRRHIIYSDGTHMYTDPIPNGTPGMSEKVEYAKNNDPTTHPVDDTDFVFNGEPLVFNGQSMTWSSIWTETAPAIGEGEYLWRRSKAVGSTTWTYTRITPESAVDFSLYCNPDLYKKNSRGVVSDSQRITVYAAPSLSITNPEKYSVTWSFLEEYENITKTDSGWSTTVYISYGVTIDKIGIQCFVSGIGTKELVIGSYQAGVTEPAYFSTGITPPAEDPLFPFIDGDYYLDISVQADGKYNNIPKVYKNGSWVDMTIYDEAYPQAMLNCCSDIFKDGNTNNVIRTESILYAYIKHLASENAMIDNLFARDIQLFDNGASVGQIRSQGYTDGQNKKGFIIKSDGTARFVDVTIDGNSKVGGDSIVEGTIINTDEDGVVVFRTNKETSETVTISGQAADGSTVPAAFMNSDFKAMLTSWLNGLTADTIYECSGGLAYSDTSYNITSIERVVNAPRTYSVRFNDYYDYSVQYHTGKLFDNIHAKPYKIDMVKGESTYKTEFQQIPRPDLPPGQYETVEYHVGLDFYVYIIDGATGDRIDVATLNSYNGNNAVQNFYVPAYSSLYVDFPSVGSYVYKHGYAEMTCKDAGNLTPGIKLQTTDHGEIDLTEIPETGINTKPQSFVVNGYGSKSIIFSASASWDIPKYYGLHYTQAPTLNVNSYVSFFTSKNFVINGKSYSVASIVFGKTYLKVNTTEGSFVLSNSDYLRQYSFSFSTKTTDKGLYALNVLPENGAQSNIGGIGTDQYGNQLRWNTVYCTTMDFINSNAGSRRELKENIKVFERDALDILNSTEIVSFNYKADREKTPKIGFIADDTDSAIAGKAHDVMDVTNCIGVLIKAIQQLSARITELEGELNGNGI